MTLTGKWSADNGNKDIYVIQNGVTVLVHWTETNPYWNYSSGIVKNNEVKMSFGGGDQLSGTIATDGSKISWNNGSSWSRVN
ncbi:hypothetical protein BLD44_005545 [Mastigocladus laminosus UU774]|nr:hypothetical protein B4U84_05785 [Westiellopsis prolifica IICB1]TFI55196.1 hypothetical protein BLD44_005545 [Mastigocladus laminosus UU774]